MIDVVIAAALLFLLLLLMPKLTTGRVLYAESFVPKLQVYRSLIERDLRGITVRIEIAHRKLYKIKILKLFKPVFDLLPSAYRVKTNRNGLFFFWAYPFDVVNVTIENDMRETFTLRHKVKDFASKPVNFFYAIFHLFCPVLLHEECIEIPTTLGKTCGYADRLSVSPGEELSLMISTRAKTFSVEFLRAGSELKKINGRDNIPGTYQRIETKFPSALGCGWKPTMQYRVPKGISSGCYLLKLNGNGNGDSSFIPVIVKPEKPDNRIAVIASTNTWHAYNSWGGQNFYINFTSFPSKYVLSTQRPFDLYVRNHVEDTCQITRDHLLVGERFVWSWLEREGFQYDLYSDTDLHSKDIFEKYLKHYKIILLSTHNEYWSYEMIEHLKEFIKAGGNVISLSGNTMYKEVSYPDENLIVLDGAYLRYQDFSEETVLGVAHDLRGFKTWDAYKVVQPDHWIFSSTGLKNGDLIGKDGLNVSLTGKPGASGWETDKIYPLAPDGTTLLAKGINEGDGGAEMVIYQENGGGSVFSVGSISFGGSLLSDSHISQITKNVVERFLKA
ncbi:MAG: hypothetical protein HZB61_03125 [Nitrospirae bacterium]|nr:hypothetical protein [Nitrospirota bacterium]